MQDNNQQNGGINPQGESSAAPQPNNNQGQPSTSNPIDAGGQPAQSNKQPLGNTPPPQSSPQQPGQMMPGQGAGAFQGMGGFQGMGPTDTGFPSGQNPPKDEPEDKTPANFKLGTLLPNKLQIKLPGHNLSFDEDNFLRLLAGSISLTKDEKRRIIETIPKLKQSQVDELIRIFEEEMEKFAQLSKKYVPQLEKLAKQHYQDWMDLETEVLQQHKKANDDAQAEEIRKQLGL